jgi:membrane-bound lytic murein transglycosylase D
MIKEAPGNYRFNRAGRNFRVQYGLKDSFQKALVNSTPYLKEMERIFAENGLPVELTRLPFAESSFNVEAHSLAGAAGIWQFTRSTGKNYMKIDRFIDERRDPLKSTEAAAKLLSFYYRQFKSWPLAITAYNHGSYAMKKAVRKTKSRDLETIINTYKGRTFGFSSRNYYVEFLAILEILKDYSQYFDAIEFLPPEKYDEFVLEDYIKVKTLLKYSSLEKEVITRPAQSRIKKIRIKIAQILAKTLPFKNPLRHERENRKRICHDRFNGKTKPYKCHQNSSCKIRAKPP